MNFHIFINEFNNLLIESFIPTLIFKDSKNNLELIDDLEYTSKVDNKQIIVDPKIIFGCTSC